MRLKVATVQISVSNIKTFSETRTEYYRGYSDERRVTRQKEQNLDDAPRRVPHERNLTLKGEQVIVDLRTMCEIIS